MMNPLPAVSGMLLLVLSANLLAADPTPVCPVSIAVSERLDTPESGWEAIADGGLGEKPYLLDNIGIYSGHPRELASLVPDQSQTNRKGIVSSWTLAAADRPYWVACHYRNTAQMLVRELPGGLRSCTVTLPAARTGLPVALHCR